MRRYDFLMKRICAVLILVSLSLLPLSALSLSVGLDAASLLSFAYDTVGINAEAGIDIGDHFRTTLSAGFYSTSSMTDDVKFISSALSADYFPFDSLGLYLGVSLLDLFFPFGLDSDGQIRFSNHIRLGYVFSLPYCAFDLRLNLRDLVSSGASDALYLSDKIGQLSRYSFSFIVSFVYDFKENKKEDL